MLWECHSLNKCYKFAISLNWMCSLPSLKTNQRPCRKNQIPPPKSWIFSGFRVARSLVFCMVFCISLLVFFLLAIALSFHYPSAASDYPFGIFKLFPSVQYLYCRIPTKVRPTGAMTEVREDLHCLCTWTHPLLTLSHEKDTTKSIFTASSRSWQCFFSVF
jgi:hypothetical protein